MIIQALCDYYRRKESDPESNIAPEGLEWKKIPFIITINLNGEFVTIEDTREGEGKKRTAKAFLVPIAEKKTSGIRSNLLWDTAEYVLGVSSPDRKRKDLVERNNAFIDRIRKELPEDNQYVQALLKFLNNEPCKQIEKSNNCQDLKNFEEIITSKPSPNLTFRIIEAIDKFSTVCDIFREYLSQQKNIDHGDERRAICLVYGKQAAVARIHSSIKGVWNAQPVGAALVSFNSDAFNSFGNTQNYNAPISEQAAFAYTTALNTLLSEESTQKLQIGDATTVFWAEKSNFLENSFASLFGFSPKDNPDMETEAIKTLYQSINTGKLTDGGNTRFYVLGLSPNAGRIAVRFWHQDTVAGLSRKIRSYFDDTNIVLSKHDDKGFALMYLLCNLVLEGKADNLPPNLVGSVMRAIFNDRPFPATLLHLAIRRIRAEQKVTRQRAAILKAVLNRSFRHNATNQKEISVSLDPTNHSPGYLLGRLFATLEKIQEDAQPGINATIRERYYGAASSSPAGVFPLLLKLKNHHLAKLDNQGQKIYYEKRLTEIFDGISYIPSHLNMEAQAYFAIGYYHQLQDFFTKKSQTETNSSQV